MLPAVVPVLVGPLQTLLALAPALLVAFGGLLFALFTPRGWRLAARFFWHQKLLTAGLLLIVASFWTGQPWRMLGRQWARLAGAAASPTATSGAADNRDAAEGSNREAVALLSSSTSATNSTDSTDSADSTDAQTRVSADSWPMFRGGVGRRGLAWLDGEPLSPGFHWTHAADTTIYSSPCVVGEQVVFATADGIGPFSPAGRGAIVSVELATGRELWRYAPDGFRATFCSPVAAEQRIVCGEGLHLVQDARVTCLDFSGRKQWEFRTRSHVEATPCIADGRVFVGAGDDGFYCLSLREVVDGAPRVLWHLPGDQFPDCESPPVAYEGTVYFGLGLGGQAVCAVDVMTGKVRWRTSTPHPAFAPPAIVPADNNRPAMLVAAIGRGNFVQSADELLAAKLDELREENASPAMLDAARRELGPAGELWWIDLATGEQRGKFAASDTILGGPAIDERGLAFGSRDGYVYRLSHTGNLLARWQAREPIVTSLVAGQDSLYAVVRSGRLYALDRETLVPRWDMRLGDGENFLSSPVLARRRLFVGTPANGLRCVGLDTPPAPPLWNSGVTGGPADDRQLPEQASLAWKVGPTKPTPSPRQWCPTPTPTSIVVIQSEEADRAGAEKAEESRVTRVIAYPVEKSATNGQTAPAPHGSWQLEGTPSLPPAAVGDRLILAFDRRLVAIDTASGSRPPRWQVQLESPSPVSMAVDHQRIVLVSGQRLESRSIETGELLFTAPHHLEAVNITALVDGSEVAGADIDATASEPPMALHLADDLLVVARGASWALFDAPTGRPLPFPKPFPHPFPKLDVPRADAMSTSLAGPNQGPGPRVRFLWRADATVVLVDDRGCTQMELERLERSRQLFANATSLLAALPITPAASNAAPGSTSNTRFLTLSKAGDLRFFESPLKTPLEPPLELSLEPSNSSTKDANTAATEITATPIWELAGLAPRPPLVAYPAVVAARDAALIRINVDDGQERDWFRWSDANLAPATPLVAVRGRVYYMTAEGSLVCLAEAP